MQDKKTKKSEEMSPREAIRAYIDLANQVSVDTSEALYRAEQLSHQLINNTVKPGKMESHKLELAYCVLNAMRHHSHIFDYLRGIYEKAGKVK